MCEDVDTSPAEPLVDMQPLRNNVRVLAASLVGTTVEFYDFFILGFANGPLGFWLSRLFPVRMRYSGMSVAFNTGGIIGGALTPIAAQMLSAAGATKYVGLLLSAAGLLTVVGVKLSRPVDPLN